MLTFIELLLDKTCFNYSIVVYSTSYFSQLIAHFPCIPSCSTEQWNINNTSKL